MNNIPIRLNFFALKNQNISFRIYRQDFNGQKKQDGYYRTKLPINDSSDTYAEYWVTTQPKDGFERVYCLGSSNPKLTVRIMWESFLDRVQKSLSSDEYILYGNGFSRKVAVIIGRHREGNEVIQIEPYYLKAEKKFGFLVDFAFKKAKDVPYSIRVQQLSLSLNKYGKSNADYYSDKLDKIKFFMQKFKQRLFPFSLDNEDYDIENELYLMRSYPLKMKTYIFSNGKESNSQVQGLKTYGPLANLDKEPLFVFMFESQDRNEALELYSSLLGKTYTNIFAGMESVYKIKLAKENVKHIIIPSLTKEGLQVVEQELQTIVESHQDKKVIGIFVMNEKVPSSITGFSPYHYVKYIFTEKRIPLQTVRCERIAARDGLKWSVGNIGLQIFAKLGGIPWKVKPSNDKCIIFGLGCAHKKDELGNINKYFAYSVCMDSSGIYRKINVLGDAKERTDYILQLRENIKSVISENLDGSIEKCVIHLPFKIKNDEIRYIKSSVQEIAHLYSDIEFQFIKINTDNKFFGYAENNSKVPYESSYIQLSSNEFLVWFEGLQYGKELVKKKVGNPVHIEFMQIDELDPEKKRRYLQDIINLSGANWRGFNAKLSPISIYYPNIIANFISEFREFQPEGDVDLTNFYIPWFL
ncbi:Piwi domain-containing protein [Anoxybacillus gonensis]|nr:Piwi domain-containing protein [Anoxybacillus gonensis]EMI10874.1 hypothetical protein F510_1003 [Anoxybacillus gonensis]